VSRPICSCSTIHARKQIFSFPSFPFLSCIALCGLWICLEQCMHIPKQLGSIVVCRYTLALQVRTIGRRCHHGSDQNRFPPVCHCREVYC
jgi:hypothetical protein